MNNENDDKGVLAHVCAILDCFSIDRPEIGVREVARMTGLTTSTAGRLMTAMKDRGILSQNPNNRGYTLGMRLLTWTGVYLTSMDIRTVAQPIMSELQQSTQETISLYVLDGTDRVCVERLESPQNVRIIARLGRRLPLYAGSAGKVMLAYLPEAKVKEIIESSSLAPFTARTITDPQVMLQELDKIRQRGFAVSHGEWTQDASGVAAPVFGPSRDVIGALTISGPTQRFTRDTIEKYAREVVTSAHEISRQMGFTNYSTTSYLRKFK
jgi:IclR family transcriptional regulator, KDG regulon repressor